MIREQRYITFKISDLVGVLTLEEQHRLAAMSHKVAAGRLKRGRQPLVCAVVESDWPEYEPTWRAIEKRVDSANKE